MPINPELKQFRIDGGLCTTGCGMPAMPNRNKCIDHLKEDSDRVLRRYRRNAEIVRAARSKPCVDCGLQLPPECMDLDHVRGVKKFKVSNICSHSDQDVIDEIAKCDVRCPNCHRLRHFRNKTNS